MLEDLTGVFTRSLPTFVNMLIPVQYNPNGMKKNSKFGITQSKYLNKGVKKFLILE